MTVKRPRTIFDRAATWWGVLGLEILLLLAPLLTTEYPPLCDLINHMARIYILADAGKNPTLAAMYHPVWHVIPNLAIDLIGPALIKLTSVSIAGRILLAIEIILCLIGTIAFHRATFGVRSYWPLGVGLILYSGLFLLGFMNFLIGTGLALLAAAAAVSKSQILQRVRVPLSCIAAIVIFFCHAWALIFYFVLLGTSELGIGGLRAKSVWPADLVKSAVHLILPAIVPGLLLYFLTAHSHGDPTIVWGDIKYRAHMAASPFINYNPAFDMVSLLLVLGTIGTLAFRNALSVPLSTKLTLALLGVLFLLCPFSVSGVFFLNARFALFLAFILFAGICPRDSNSVPWAVPAGLLTLLLVARIAIIGEVWRSSRQDIADLRILGASLPPGSRVLATQVLADEDRAGYYRDQPLARELRGLASTTYYLPSLWLIERQAFFPLLFADPALHPLEVSEGYRNVSLASFGFPPDYRALADHDRAEREVKSSPYLAGWEQHFDYVVVLNAGRAKHLDSLDTLPLALIGKTDIAALYRIVR